MWQHSWPQERGLTASSTLSSIQKPDAIYTRSQQAPKLLRSLRGSIIKIGKSLLEANLSGKESHRKPVPPVMGVGNAFLRALAWKGGTARLRRAAPHRPSPPHGPAQPRGVPEAPALRDGKCDRHRGSQPRRAPPGPYLPPEVRRGARRHRLTSIPAAAAARSRRRRRPSRPRRLLRSRGGHGLLKWRRPERLRRLREAPPIVRRDSREEEGLLLTGSPGSQSEGGAAAGLEAGRAQG